MYVDMNYHRFSKFVWDSLLHIMRTNVLWLLGIICMRKTDDSQIH